VDDDVIQIADEYYIRATSSRADERYRVLKHDETFGVFDRYGDIQPYGLGEHGIFHEGTRFLSRLELRLGRQRPVLLSSAVSRTNDLFTVDLANPDVPEPSHERRIALPRGVIHIFRAKYIWKARCHERLRITNYGAAPHTIRLGIRFDADFADIFEVRGARRPRRGSRLEPLIEGPVCALRYLGLDGVSRSLVVAFSRPPTDLMPGMAWFELTVPARGHDVLDVTFGCSVGETAGRMTSAGFHEALASVRHRSQATNSGWPQVSSNNGLFNGWVDRSVADLQMMLSETPEGAYPYAGVPWFSTVFGRDGVITALQVLWAQPEIARGVLAHLAALQAVELDPHRDAAPGKIVHERRRGEMAALGEVPFGLYYGSIDATPLFVMLAGAYFRRTGELEFVRALWPHVQRALAWIDQVGDRDADGFVEYARENPEGLLHQGWKDSGDSVFHADGSLAEPPIALCEVQAYVYGAFRAAGDIAGALGHVASANDLRTRARELRRRFEEAFWCDDLRTYAIALDGRKNPCRVRASNAGHCLYTGIASPERARKTARTLLSETGFSGWGIRTVASSEARYNPMSYHNGSVWPHDNGIIAAGFSRYGLHQEALRPFTSLFDSTLVLDQQRLPELFCGFERRPGEGPTLYPVACMPQAWAAGTVFMLLEAALGISIDARACEVRLSRPKLPAFLGEVRLTGLRVGPARLDLLLERREDDVGVTIVNRSGRVRVVVAK
jgi:glycogen debranching enzyme